MDAVIKNSYFKLLANDITPSILKKFSLEKIKSNIKTNAYFLYSPIKKISMLLIVTTTCLLLSLQWQRAEKIVSFDIAGARAKKLLFSIYPKQKWYRQQI